MNELVKTELFSLLSESSQENTNEEMQSAKVILYSFEIQKYTQGIERKTPSPTGFYRKSPHLRYAPGSISCKSVALSIP